jgi:hypothetical protein
MKLTLDCDSLEVTGISSEEQDHSSRTGSLELPPLLKPRRLALIAATSDYRDPTLHRLRAPGTDAEAVAEVLGEPDAITSRTPGVGIKAPWSGDKSVPARGCRRLEYPGM